MEDSYSYKATKLAYKSLIVLKFPEGYKRGSKWL